MLLTVAEAAKLRKTTRFSIHRWIRAGLPATRLGSQFVIERAALVRFRPRAVGNPNFKK